MNRCETCAYWEDVSDYAKSPIGKNLCGLQDNFDDKDDSPIESQDCSGDSGFIFTAASFGCVEWKAKENAPL